MNQILALWWYLRVGVLCFLGLIVVAVAMVVGIPTALGMRLKIALGDR